MKNNSRGSRPLSRQTMTPLKLDWRERLRSKHSEAPKSLSPQPCQQLEYVPLVEAIPRSMHIEEVHSITHSCLRAHDISKEFRAKMVDWMVEVTSTFRCDTETFFISVKLMDMFMKQHFTSLLLHELHCIGVTCMFIASKMQDVKPLILEIVVKKIAHNQLTRSDIRAMEQRILRTLDFRINLITVFDSLINFDLQLSSDLFHKTQELCKLTQYFPEYGEARPSSLALACVVAAAYSLGDVAAADQALKIDTGDTGSLHHIVRNLERDAKSFHILYPNLKNVQKFSKTKIVDN